jgi:hypothetical protein
LVVEIRPCNARQQSYHSDPSHVKHSTKIRGVSRDHPYLGLCLELEDGSCHTMGKRDRPPGSKDSRQRFRGKKPTAPRIPFRSASEIASRSAFVASMRTMESPASLAADAHQDNNETLRNIELEVDLPLGSIEEMDYYEQTMSQQDFLSENIDAELDEDRDIDIMDTTKGTMANFLKAVHRELREQVRGRYKHHMLGIQRDIV